MVARSKLKWPEALAAWVLLSLLLALVAFQMYDASRTPANIEKAPDFQLTTFEGKNIRLGDFLGKVVVINFWASWCIPCREEALVLEAAWQEFRNEGVVFIGVDYLDTDKDALAFIDEFDITYYNGPDIESRISTAYRIRGIPETFFIDRQGFLQSVFIGAIDEAELHRRISALLGD
jgi:cytochrome c biogenesis protein CcmG, thiol:disulfide interchange protein DsbE